MKICIGSVLLLCLVRNSLAQDQRPNLARGKPAEQVDTAPPYIAERAVNGQTACSESYNFTHTISLNNTWWTVDLQRFVRNPSVKIFRRSGPYNGLYRVSMGNFSRRSIVYAACGQIDLSVSTNEAEILCQDMIGRFVAVELVTTGKPLCLCEVEVRGDIVEKNRALNQITNQSSTYSGDGKEHGSHVAVNGRRGGLFTHTLNDVSKWWLVDLRGQILIYKFIITPRVGNDYRGHYSTIIRNSSALHSSSLTCQNKSISSATTTFNCSGLVQGRYAVVIYSIPRVGPLCMHEVEVYGFCRPGNHGSQCDQTCPTSCEGPCDEETGNCIQCPEGKWGTECNKNCGNCSKGKCEKVSGNCLGNCTPGYHGSKCDQKCQKNCYQSTCQKEDGVCIGCKKGLWGSHCTNQCGNCLNGTCDQTDASCSVCEIGFYGQECNNSCPANCGERHCLKHDGSCTVCKQGFWNTHCTGKCGNCVERACNQTDAACPSSCTKRFYGLECNNSCPANCKEDTCLQQDGSCVTCKEEYFGKHCNSTCAMNCASKCNKDNGTCAECRPGTWGSDFCENNCPDGCEMIDLIRSCDRGTGRCVRCQTGFHGKDCSKKCSKNCSDGCNQDSSRCWSCVRGTHGDACTEPCPYNCGGDKSCNRTSSKCSECLAGYHGDQCSFVCPNCSNNKTCFQGNGSCVACPTSRYGATCNERCGKGCERGVCDRDDGTCTCSNGYATPKCQKQDVQDHSGSPPSGAAIGGGVGGVLFVLVLILLVIIWVRRGKPIPGKKTSPGSPMRDFSNGPLGRPPSKEVLQSHLYNDPEPMANPAFVEPDESAYVNLGVQVSHLPDYIMHLRQRDTGMEDEFKGIPTNPVSAIDYGRLPQHVPKNRFRNIIPYDNNRVRLLAPPDDDENDYVNASYIMAYNKEKNFIAAQGPNSVSFDDFIKLLWEQNVPLIIMVTKVEENKKTKCEKYWPDLQQTWNRGGVKLTTLREEQLPHYSIRTIRMRKDGEVHEIEQLQYTAWPDHGVPECPASFLDFVQKAKKLYQPEVGPTLVHCSAGVGRTGTFLAVDYLLEQAKAEGRVEVQGVVTALRKQRISMVQSMDQYKFIYEALVEALHCGQTVYPVTSYRTITGQDLQRQFQILNKLTRIKTSADNLSAARDPSNQSKNRDAKVLPSNQSRPFLMTQVSGRNDYVNAVFTKSYAKNDKYIVTQTPLPDTIVDFWRLVYDYTCGTIISLNRFNTPGCPAYWAKAPCRYGPFRVECVSEEKNGHMIMRTLKLTIKEEERRVQQFEVTTWDSDVPPTTSLQVLVEDHTRALSADDKILVHCLDGCERSGVFCAFVHVCDKITEEHEVDVFHAVKKIREGRPEFITSQMQYQWLHDAARDYISSFDTYANFK